MEGDRARLQHAPGDWPPQDAVPCASGERRADLISIAKPRSSLSQTVINILSGYLAYGVAVALNLVLVPVMVHSLGDSQYGIWRFFLAALGYFMLLDLGLENSLTYFVARHSSRGEGEALTGYVSSVAVLYLLLGVVAAVIGIAVGRATAEFFKLPVGVGQSAVALAGWTAAVTLVFSPFGGVLTGLQRHDVNSLFNVAVTIAGGLLTIVLLRAHYGLVHLMLLSLMLYALAGVARCVWVLRRCGIRIISGSVTPFYAKRALGYGFWSLLTAVAWRLSFDSADIMVISRFLSVERVAVYSIAVAPLAMLSPLVWRLANVFMPLFTAQQSSDSVSRAGRTYLSVVCLLLAGYMPVLLMLWGSGRTIISWWVGAQYLDAYPILLVLSVAYLGNFVGLVSAALLLGLAKHRVLALLALVQAALNVGMSVVLVQRVGILGVALGTLAAVAPFYGLVLPYYVCRSSGLSFKDYADAMLRVMVVGAFVLGSWHLLPVSRLSVWPRLGLNACWAGGLFPVLAWRFVLSPVERRVAIDAASQLTANVRRRPSRRDTDGG